MNKIEKIQNCKNQQFTIGKILYHFYNYDINNNYLKIYNYEDRRNYNNNFSEYNEALKNYISTKKVF